MHSPLIALPDELAHGLVSMVDIVPGLIAHHAWIESGSAVLDAEPVPGDDRA